MVAVIRSVHQVALLEGKRILQKITEGKADITDELLGQMMGQALALQRNSERTVQARTTTPFHPSHDNNRTSGTTPYTVSKP